MDKETISFLKLELQQPRVLVLKVPGFLKESIIAEIAHLAGSLGLYLYIFSKRFSRSVNLTEASIYRAVTKLLEVYDPYAYLNLKGSAKTLEEVLSSFFLVWSERPSPVAETAFKALLFAQKLLSEEGLHSPGCPTDPLSAALVIEAINNEHNGKARAVAVFDCGIVVSEDTLRQVVSVPLFVKPIFVTEAREVITLGKGKQLLSYTCLSL